MADREQSHTSKNRADQKLREHGVQHRDIVGNDVPDESKERHTEIAVEVGNKGSKRQNQQH